MRLHSEGSEKETPLVLESHILFWMKGQKQRRDKKLFVGSRGRALEDFRGKGMSEVM